MIAHTYYDEDPRVRREADALHAAGWPVRVISLRRVGERATGQVDGVVVHRVGIQRHQGSGLPTYAREYLSFAVRAARLARRLHRRQPMALVQVHSLPDFLALAALPLRLAGVPLILDLHEAMPEFFRSRFPHAANRLSHALLRAQERLSIALSSHTITVTDAMRDRLVGLGVPADQVSVIRNGPDLSRFDPARHPARPFAHDGIVRLVYAGGLTPTYELDVAVRALAELDRQRPGQAIHLDLYGRGDSEGPLRALATRLGVADRLTFHGRVPIEAVAAAIGAADLGLAPTRRDAFTELTISTKVYEYAAMGKPVIATRLPVLERAFPEGAVSTYASGDHLGLALAIGQLIDDPVSRLSAVERARSCVEQAAWQGESIAYLALIERFAAPTRPGRGSAGDRP